MAGLWRPGRTREEQLDRAVRSMVPGSWQGKIAQAMPVRDRFPNQVESLDEEQAASAGVLFYQDSFLLTGPDDLVHQLTYTPLEHSEHVYWEGIYQPESEWSRAGFAITLKDPDGFLQALDRIDVEYAYVNTDLDSYDPGTVLLDWASPGWKWKQFGLADTTDRSAPGFDDSAWATGAAPFGNGSFGGHPSPATVWAAQNKIWARKTVTVNVNVLVRVSYRVDNYVTVYANGVKVFGQAGTEGAPSEAANAGSFTLSAGANVIAVEFKDDTTLYTGDGTYGDIRLVTA